MENIQNTIVIPQNALKEICWHLKNYNKLDEHIEKRKKEVRDDINDYYHFTNKNYLKSIYGNGSTLEDCIIAIEEDKKINRYLKWKKLINKYMNDIDNKNDFISYWIIKYVYFDKRDIEYVKEYLNIDKYELKEIIMQSFSDIYQRAVEEKIFKEVI